jgi:hypothetical protein
MIWMPDGLTELALAALGEITSPASVGQELDRVDEGEGVVSLRFATTQAGYPGWSWTVSIAQLEGEEPSVLEVELLPGEGALLAPDWVPWSERLAEWKAAQAAAAESEDGPSDPDASEDDESDDDSMDDDSDDDESEDDDDEFDDDADILHSGDVDGVDIDEALGDEDDDSGDEDADDEPGDADDGRQRRRRV